MNNLNTTKKGNSFERQVYVLLSELLQNDELFMNGKKSKIFWKKSYYSNKTMRDVEVDISIETYLKGSDKYSILTVIECKNYNSSVVLNDIREFDSILNEIGEHNTKGILITTSVFQIGIVNFAKSSGIGLARVNEKNEIDWISYRLNQKSLTLSDEQVECFLVESEIKEKNFFSVYKSNYYEKLPELLQQFEIIDNYKSALNNIIVPYISDREIESIILEIPRERVFDDKYLDNEKLCQFITEKFGVNFILNKKLNNNILGRIRFDPLEISVSNEIEYDIYRWRFTLAHEIGHLILHRELLMKYINEKTDDEMSFDNISTPQLSNSRRLEIQANKFASRLLLPHNALLREVHDYFVKENIRKGYLYFDRQPVNMSLVLNLLREIQYKFGVSKEVVKYRLIELNLLEDHTNVSVNTILRKQY